MFAVSGHFEFRRFWDLGWEEARMPTARYAIGIPLIADLLDICGKRIHISIVTVNRFTVLMSNWANFTYRCPHLKNPAFSDS
jgi:hypothetical protein